MLEITGHEQVDIVSIQKVSILDLGALGSSFLECSCTGGRFVYWCDLFR